ncbi:hypothetical protein [Planktothricoides raciborskii]|uniref:Uncharacterized protein n=1 Tax=Planktothricoides raciborskii GIHE-MW2 TaxID=2792601 RepID=A0AAU8JA09_9CYAN
MMEFHWRIILFYFILFNFFHCTINLYDAVSQKAIALLVPESDRLFNSSAWNQ